ncbi:1,4-alpha-glucan branching enzyme GlgB [compost metagenome]
MIFNFTPVPRHGYRVGVHGPGYYREIVNTDAAELGGSGIGNLGGVHAEQHPAHERSWSVRLSLPPLGAIYLKAP